VVLFIVCRTSPVYCSVCNLNIFFLIWISCKWNENRRTHDFVFSDLDGQYDSVVYKKDGEVDSFIYQDSRQVSLKYVLVLSIVARILRPVQAIDSKRILAALIIRGLFICEFAYSRSLKVHQTSGLTVFLSLICDFLVWSCMKLN
jgi:hypothetical protein